MSSGRVTRSRSRSASMSSAPASSALSNSRDGSTSSGRRPAPRKRALGGDDDDDETSPAITMRSAQARGAGTSPRRSVVGTVAVSRETGLGQAKEESPQRSSSAQWAGSVTSAPASVSSSPTAIAPEYAPTRVLGRYNVRAMTVDDLFPVWKLGQRCFQAKFANLSRLWESFTVSEAFSSDPEYCFVAEDSDNEEVIGFAIGSFTRKRSWSYGYLEWLAVDQIWQGRGVAHSLFERFRVAMKEADVRILLIDTQANNAPAIRFFQKLGFKNELQCVYLSLDLPPPENVTHDPEVRALIDDNISAIANYPALPPRLRGSEKAIAQLKIRDMTLADVAMCFHIGERVFTADKQQSHFRTWDHFVPVHAYNSEPDLCVVADVAGTVIGFALGTTVTKKRGMKLAYLAWIAVAPEWTRLGVGTSLYNELLSRFQAEDCKAILIDTEVKAIPALEFFYDKGFNHPSLHVYLDRGVDTYDE